MEEIIFQKRIEEIKARVDTKTTLHISRIPEKSKTRFVELAKEEFADDYGMTIKFLLDFRDGILMTPNQALVDEVNQIEQALSAKIDLLADEVNKLKEQNVRKGRRMNDGRVIQHGA